MPDNPQNLNSQIAHNYSTIQRHQQRPQIMSLRNTKETKKKLWNKTHAKNPGQIQMAAKFLGELISSFYFFFASLLIENRLLTEKCQSAQLVAAYCHSLFRYKIIYGFQCRTAIKHSEHDSTFIDAIFLFLTFNLWPSLILCSKHNSTPNKMLESMASPTKTPKKTIVLSLIYWV